MNKRQEPRIKTAERCLAILEYIVRMQRPVSNKELAVEFRSPPSTIHHIVSTLSDLGYLASAPERQYVLGRRFLKLTEQVHKEKERFSLAKPVLMELRDRFDENVYLNSYEYGMVNSVMVLESSHPVRVSAHMELNAPSEHCTASGKIMLAYGDRKIYEHYTSFSLRQWTENTITDCSELAKELEGVRIQGFAEDREEHFVGIQCVAVPIFGVSDELTGSVSFRVPSYRMNDELGALMIDALHSAAESIFALCLDDEVESII